LAEKGDREGARGAWAEARRQMPRDWALGVELFRRQAALAQ
jgi:hypothetical protein